MIPKITPSFDSKFASQARKLPQKEVIITSKNGRDYISDVFIGGVPRYSVMDALRELFERFFTNTHVH